MPFFVWVTMSDLLPLTAVLPFFVASIAIELTPGPNMAYLAVLSAQRGRGAGMLAVVGVSLGLSIIGVLAAFGFGTFIAENRVLYELLRWGGVAFLLWLAWDAWREARRPLEDADLTVGGWQFFNRGLITNLLNPKAFAFYVTVLPGFTNSQKQFWAQALQLTAVYVLAATLVHAGIVLGAGGVTGWFTRPNMRRMLGNVFALLLIGIAIWVVINTTQK